VRFPSQITVIVADDVVIARESRATTTESGAAVAAELLTHHLLDGRLSVRIRQWMTEVAVVVSGWLAE
jgi:hypothetical protein